MQLTVPDDKKRVYERVIPIRGGGMDAMGHVNNTSYFRHFETVRIDWMHSVCATADPQGEGPVIARLVSRAAGVRRSALRPTTAC